MYSPSRWRASGRNGGPGCGSPRARHCGADVQLGLAPFAQQVDVVGVGPTPGSGVDRDRVPATVSVVTAAELEDRHAASLADALHEQLGSVTLEGATTNLFQPTLRFRGFTASPLLGLPQGVAVYQNGVRINEPFGDTVQFDLIPQFAVDQVQLSAGAEPTYGLNALGGAMVLNLKNGFEHTGFRGEFSAGSFDRYTATAEWGANNGPWAVYLGATRFDETGWRVASPSEVTQAVADVAYRDETIDAGVSFTYADSRLNGNAPAPVELLDAARSAVFTYPDTTENRLGFVQGRFDVAVSPTWSVQVTGYYRDLERRTLNGDEAEFEECDDDFLPFGAPAGTLCFGADDDDDDDEEEEGENGHDDGDDDDNGAMGFAAMDDDDNGAGDHGDDDDDDEARPLVDVTTGRFITEDDAEGNAAFNRTTTRSKGYGATVQAVAATDVGAGENVLTLGVSADLADVGFTSTSEVGSLTRDRTVTGSGLLAGIYGEAPDDLFNTGLDTANSAVGLYFSDTLSFTERTHLTVSGRFNHARIEIADRLGTSLDGEHSFSRFNVGTGLVHQFGDAVSVFGRYGESNRAPTAAELSCADPAEPCRVPNAFISDPPLEQAVARSVEGGLRGRAGDGSAWRLNWSVAVYHTAIADDILFVASPELIGTGYFQNAGDTRRIGLDAELNGQVRRLGWYAGYGLVDATFRSPLELPGDAGGQRRRHRGRLRRRRAGRPHAGHPAPQLQGRPALRGARRLGRHAGDGHRLQPRLRRRRGQRSGPAGRLRHRQPALGVPRRRAPGGVRAGRQPVRPALRDVRRPGRAGGVPLGGAERQRSALRLAGHPAERLRRPCACASDVWRWHRLGVVVPDRAFPAPQPHILCA